MVDSPDIINSYFDAGTNTFHHSGGNSYTFERHTAISTERHNVYDGLDSNGKPVKVKIPFMGQWPKLASPDIEEKLIDLLEEAWVLYSVPHPNIVKLLDFELANVSGLVMPAIIMERAEGRQINDSFLQSLPLENKLKLIDTIAKPVDYIHSKGVIHRDIGHKNVVTPSDVSKAKLVDFEIAMRVGSKSRHEVAYRPGYAPINIVNGDPWRIVDEIWSYTALTYYILTNGNYPYGGWGNDALIEQNVGKPEKLGKLDSLSGYNGGLERLNQMYQQILNDRDPDFDTCKKVSIQIHEVLTYPT